MLPVRVRSGQSCGILRYKCPTNRVASAQAQEWYREDLVGQAIIESGIPREELFLTSKLHPRHHGYDSAMIQV